MDYTRKMGLTPLESLTWPEEVIQILDEHHLVALSDSAGVRERFAGELATRLGGLPETDVVVIDGLGALTLPQFCHQLCGHVGGNGDRSVERTGYGTAVWWHDEAMLLGMLRRVPETCKRRYVVWSDADAMLNAGREMFSRVVNTLLAAAAEREHLSVDRLVLQRVVFIGGRTLGEYANNAEGQFHRWLEDDSVDSTAWEVASVLEKPPVVRVGIREGTGH